MTRRPSLFTPEVIEAMKTYARRLDRDGGGPWDAIVFVEYVEAEEKAARIRNEPAGRPGRASGRGLTVRGDGARSPR